MGYEIILRYILIFIFLVSPLATAIYLSITVADNNKRDATGNYINDRSNYTLNCIFMGISWFIFLLMVVIFFLWNIVGDYIWQKIPADISNHNKLLDILFNGEK